MLHIFVHKRENFQTVVFFLVFLPKESYDVLLPEN